MALLDNTASILIQAFQGPWQGKWKNWFRIDRWCIKEFFLMWESLRDFSFYGHLMPLLIFLLHMLIFDNIWRHHLKSLVWVMLPKFRFSFFTQYLISDCCFIYHPTFHFGLLFHFSPNHLWPLFYFSPNRSFSRPLFHFSPNCTLPDRCFIFHPIVGFQTVVSFFTQNLAAARFEPPTSRSNT